MYFHEAGVLENSRHALYDPSPFARQVHFYLTGIGRFEVQPPYHVYRLNYNSYLLMLIHRGQIHVEAGGRSWNAGENTAILLNCHQPHRYFALKSSSFSFFHFDGAMSASLYDMIAKRNGTSLSVSEDSQLPVFFRQVFEEVLFREHPDEWKISLLIYQTLGIFLKNCTAASSIPGRGNPIAVTEQYIHRHLDEAMSVETLSGVSGFSPCYFQRRFKAETGLTPHRYIMKARLDKSRQLLKTTSMTVQQIALEVGFSSASNYICAFTKEEGMSPTEFRKMPL